MGAVSDGGSKRRDKRSLSGSESDRSPVGRLTSTPKIKRKGVYCSW